MTTGIIYLDCFIGGVIGILCHVLLLKLPAMKKRAENANTDFKVSEYLKNDWLTIAGSFITVFVAIFVLDELLAMKPSVAKWVKFFFVFVGYTGSSILQGIFSKTETQIQKVIDVKTNIADNKYEKL